MRGGRAPVRLGGMSRLGRHDGQALSEYVAILGILVATVIACMTMYLGPVSAVYIRLFRRMVLYLTSTS